MVDGRPPWVGPPTMSRSNLSSSVDFASLVDNTSTSTDSSESPSPIARAIFFVFPKTESNITYPFIAAKHPFLRHLLNLGKAHHEVFSIVLRTLWAGRVVKIKLAHRTIPRFHVIFHFLDPAAGFLVRAFEYLG